VERHQRKQKKYVVKGNAINGYGSYAARDFPKGEIVMKVEGTANASLPEIMSNSIGLPNSKIRSVDMPTPSAARSLSCGTKSPKIGRHTIIPANQTLVLKVLIVWRCAR